MPFLEAGCPGPDHLNGSKAESERRRSIPQLLKVLGALKKLLAHQPNDGFFFGLNGFQCLALGAQSDIALGGG